MYTVIIFAVIGGIVGYLTARSWSEDYVYEILGRSFFFSIVGVIVMIALPTDTYIKQSSEKIETLQDNGSTKGSFFLGSGQINGEMNYVFYVKDGIYFQMHVVSYKRAVVAYTDSIPSLTTYEREKTEHWKNNFGFDFNTGTVGYCINVPKGTIKNVYNLDAK